MNFSRYRFTGKLSKAILKIEMIIVLIRLAFFLIGLFINAKG